MLDIKAYRPYLFTDKICYGATSAKRNCDDEKIDIIDISIIDKLNNTQRASSKKVDYLRFPKESICRRKNEIVSAYHSSARI